MVAALRALGTDVRYAWKRMTRSVPVTLTTIALLTTSVGLATAAYAVLDTLVLRQLPSPNPEQLVLVSGVGTTRRTQLTLSLFDHLSTRREYASHVFGFGSNLVQGTTGDTTRMLLAYGVVGDYFTALGGAPAVGRYLTPGDTETFAVISHRLWRSSFAADPNAIGRSLRLGSTDLQIIGVTPAEFRTTNLHANWDLIVPRRVLMAVLDTPPGADPPVELGARLKPGVGPDVFASQLNALWPALLEDTVPAGSSLARWREQRGDRVRVDALEHGLNYALELRPTTRRTAIMTFGLAVFILIATCVTLALIATVRGARDERQTAIRLALGATRSGVLRQALIESAIVSVVASGGGLLLGSWLSRVGTSFLPSAADLDWDIRMPAEGVWIAAGIAVAAAAIGGVIPATVGWRRMVGALLQFGGGIPRPHVRLRTALLLLQLATSVVLVQYALGFAGDLRALARVDAGFPLDDLRVYSLTGRYGRRLLDEQYFVNLTAQMASLPGVQSVGLTGTGPLPFVSQQELSRPIRTSDGREAQATPICTFPGFFDGIGLPLRAGRDVAWKERGAAVLSESAARALFPNMDPIGQVVHSQVLQTARSRALQVTGVVGDLAYNGPRGGPRPIVFTPCLDQNDPRPSTFVVNVFVRSPRPVAELEQDVESALMQSGAQLVYRRANVADDLASSIQQERTLAAVAGAFAVGIALLTAVGLYAFCSYVSAMRTKELAIRAGLGATSFRLATSLVPELVVVLVAGSAAGIGGTLLLRGVLIATLGEVVLPAPTHIVMGALAVTLLAMTATALPTWRALRLDIARALRSEQ